MDLSGLYNAKLVRIDVPQPADPGGNVAYTSGAAIGVDCVVDAPTNAQRWTLGGTIGTSDAVLYVMRDELGAGVSIDKGYRLVYRIDGEAADATKIVEYVRIRTLEEISHYELFLKEVG